MFAVSTPARSQKKVFAHYMVCCPSFGNAIDSLKKEIKEAQAVGIDGFALNCGGWFQENYKTKVTRMYDAAEQLNPGFKLFISADMCGANDRAAIKDMIVSFGNRPAQLKQNQKIVLSTFSGEGQGESFWRN